MKAAAILAALWLTLLGAGTCPARAQRGPVSPLARVKRVAIPLDEKQPGAEVSLARNFYFIFDGSGSMADPLGRACSGDKKAARKIDGAQAAVAEFMKAVPPAIHLGLYVFDSRRRAEVLPLGADNREPFLKAVDDVRAGGGTPLAEAIRAGTDALVKQYQKQLGYGEFRLVVVTDGIADDIPAAATYAAQRGIPIYAIGLCIGADHPLRRYAVSYRAADSFKDLQRGLEDTLAELPDVAPTDFQ
jgi:Ca-activated chloride channel family protein